MWMFLIMAFVMGIGMFKEETVVERWTYFFGFIACITIIFFETWSGTALW